MDETAIIRASEFVLDTGTKLQVKRDTIRQANSKTIEADALYDSVQSYVVPTDRIVYVRRYEVAA